MDKDVKRYIMNVMKGGTGGCKHQEMTQAMNCQTCQMKMIKARSEYDRLRKEYPEKFIRKEVDVGFSNDIQNKMQMMDDRENNDNLYREHLKLMAHGTPEEKLREYKREMNGFYQRHVGDYRRKTL